MRSSQKLLIIIAFLLGLWPSLKAQQCNLTLRGHVLHAGTNEPMAYANIVIKETNDGVMADEEGHYTISGLCAGTYTIVCSRVGCTHEEHLITLSDNTIKDFFLEEHSITIEQVVIESNRLRPTETQATAELSGAELESGKGLNLAESLKRLPGVTTLNTGATIAKPVIQGLHSNRVLIMTNGVRLEGQQWGLEHAPEVDPFLADKVTVIKGASGVRYGADAMGGVILVEPRPLRGSKGIGGEVNLQGFSNGRTGVASGMIEGRLGGKLPLVGRLQGTIKRGGNLRAPDYFLNNTGVSERNFSWTLGLDKDDWSTEVFYSNFYTKLGILADAHIGNLTDLENAIERGRPLEDGSFTYELGRPLQRVLHELVKAKSSVRTGDAGRLSLQYSRQFNRRQEFDAHRPFGNLPESTDDPDIEFEITTHAGDISWEHKPVGNWRGTIGATYLWQRNTTDRGALIPNYESQTAGAYWIERWKKYPVPIELEAGIRYDYKWMSVGRQGTDTIGQQLNFNSFSGTLGAIYTFPRLVRLRFNFGTAWRPPQVNELFSEGVHHGSASYEKGNPDLQPERAFNTSLTAEFDNQKNLSATITAYYNLIDDFIFAEPAGEPVLTIRGAFPAFEYNQTDARLMGIDWSVDYEFIKKLTLESRGSLLRAWNRKLDDHLVFMPADRFQTSLKYAFSKTAAAGQPPFIRLTMVNVLEQKRAPEDIDYAPPPPGYTRFDLEAGATFRLRNQPFEVGLSVLNIFNTSYREYLNRFRYFVDEPGRNLLLRLRVPFGLTD